MSTSWETTRTKDVFNNRWLSLHIDTIKHPKTDLPYKYTYIHRHHNGVVIIPYFPKINSFILTHQYRHPIKKSIWQFPGGGQEPSKSLLATAKNELLEETGYEANNLKLLGKLNIDPGIIDNQGFIYLALEPTVSKIKKAHDPQEIISTKIFKQKDFESMIRNGKIQDGWTLAAFTLFKIYQNT